MLFEQVDLGGLSALIEQNGTISIQPGNTEPLVLAVYPISKDLFKPVSSYLLFDGSFDERARTMKVRISKYYSLDEFCRSWRKMADLSTVFMELEKCKFELWRGEKKLRIQKHLKLRSWMGSEPAKVLFINYFGKEGTSQSLSIVLRTKRMKIAFS